MSPPLGHAAKINFCPWLADHGGYKIHTYVLAIL